GSVFYRYEGYLFPDTYEFYMYESPDVVIQKMMNNFDHKMSDELLAKIRKSGYSLHEVMTLASIVQGEAGDSVNMAKVAAVYINRLNNVETFPKLQANPTTNYAKQQILPYRNYGKNADLAAAAYDCYQSDGLPPGPINNPGLKAITAVLEPDMTCDAYFFCTDRVTKEFYYAKTYEEHKANTVKAGLAK
ncbi:MAG: endolytic transglycosylase MltG, partial [Oscillospiraceae bacterium]